MYVDGVITVIQSFVGSYATSFFLNNCISSLFFTSSGFDLLHFGLSEAVFEQDPLDAVFTRFALYDLGRTGFGSA